MMLLMIVFSKRGKFSFHIDDICEESYNIVTLKLKSIKSNRRNIKYKNDILSQLFVQAVGDGGLGLWGKGTFIAKLINGRINGVKNKI